MLLKYHSLLSAAVWALAHVHPPPSRARTPASPGPTGQHQLLLPIDRSSWIEACQNLVGSTFPHRPILNSMISELDLYGRKLRATATIEEVASSTSNRCLIRGTLAALNFEDSSLGFVHTLKGGRVLTSH